MYKFLFYINIFLGSHFLNGQNMVGVSARYDDSFREWDIFDDSETIIGAFSQLWQQADNWREWNVQYGDAWGTIRQKWRNDNSRWELRLNGETITIRTIYPNDPNQWVITDNNFSLDLTTKFPYNFEEWNVKSKTLGVFEMNMYYQKDPRDWEINDELSEDVSPAIRLAIMFTVLMVSMPKV